MPLLNLSRRVVMSAVVVSCVLSSADRVSSAENVGAASTRPSYSAFRLPQVAWVRPIGQLAETPASDSSLKHRPVHYIDGTSSPTADEPYYQTGVPLGGIGAGNFCRTYYGNFNHWQLNIGTNFRQSVPADQFSVFMQTEEGKVAQVLYAGKGPYRWAWDYPVGAGHYYALYPRAWWTYDWNKFPARLAVRQISPIMPNNLKESSYPAGVFEWYVENPTAKPVVVSIMLTWANDFPGDLRFGKRHRVVKQGPHVGVVMDSANGRIVRVSEGTANERLVPTSEMDGGELCIAARLGEGMEATTCEMWPASGDGKKLWEDFADDGRLSPETAVSQPAPPVTVTTRKATEIDQSVPAAALAIRVELKPNSSAKIPVAISWDIPWFNFGAESRMHAKRYTVFWGESADRSFDIAADALTNYSMWERRIDAWQHAVLDDHTRCDEYKIALFNELYRIGQGGTAWNAEGKFTTISCFDYLTYSSYDVRFQVFPFAMLWPSLDWSVHRVWSDLIRRNNGYTPDGSGDPYTGDHWYTINTYQNAFRDSPSKFVLQVYRNLLLTGDREAARFCWPSCKWTLQRLTEFDSNDDGLPENRGEWDNTYDGFPMKGTSAYCAGLYLTALQAAEKMADSFGEEDVANRYRGQFARGNKAYQQLLWNGRYYNHDTGSGPLKDSIFADMVAGQWYADVCRLPGYIPEDRMISCLQTIYDTNVLRVNNGNRGAMNAMRPDGTIDARGQGAEVWPGTSYCVAATMLYHGMDAEAEQVLKGLYRTTYVDRAYWFNTPEAWHWDGHHPRAFMYLRPLAVWAVEDAYTRRRGQGLSLDVLAPTQSLVSGEIGLRCKSRSAVRLAWRIDREAYQSMEPQADGTFLAKWDTRQVSDGIHRIILCATSETGAVKTRALSFEAKNGLRNKPPVVVGGVRLDRKDASAKKVAVYWKRAADKDIDYYRVYRTPNDQTPIGPKYLVGHGPTPDTTSCVVDHETGVYRVTAVDTEGLEGVPSAPAKLP